MLDSIRPKSPRGYRRPRLARSGTQNASIGGDTRTFTGVNVSPSTNTTATDPSPARSWAMRETRRALPKAISPLESLDSRIVPSMVAPIARHAALVPHVSAVARQATVNQVRAAALRAFALRPFAIPVNIAPAVAAP